jgi:anaerobic carbon-monoxide dehydrogenase iron sulfur subunit
MLNFIEEKCVNCKICEEICSFRLCEAIHPSVAAIRIGRAEGRWGTPFAKVCNLCAGLDQQECIAACPEEGALTLSGNTVVWDMDKCTLCEDCLDVCPQDAVTFDPQSSRINICDLCGGNPLCIEWCPEDAISLEHD